MKDRINRFERVDKAFQANYRAGGIEACRNMVDDLYAVSEAARVFIDFADDVVEESAITQDANLTTSVTLTEELVEEAESAVQDYKFASFLLRTVE